MPASDVLQQVKLRLAVTDTSRDSLLLSYVNEMGQRIRHYCHVEDVPIALEPTWVSMVMDAYRGEQSEAAVDMKIGDTSVKTGGYTMKSTMDSVIFNYTIDLNRYRKLRW